MRKGKGIGMWRCFLTGGNSLVTMKTTGKGDNKRIVLLPKLYVLHHTPE
jgi:hypothetical protein